MIPVFVNLRKNTLPSCPVSNHVSSQGADGHITTRVFHVCWFGVRACLRKLALPATRETSERFHILLRFREEFKDAVGCFDAVSSLPDETKPAGMAGGGESTERWQGGEQTRVACDILIFDHPANGFDFLFLPSSFCGPSCALWRFLSENGHVCLQVYTAFRPEDGVSLFRRSVGMNLQVHMA